MSPLIFDQFVKNILRNQNIVLLETDRVRFNENIYEEIEAKIWTQDMCSYIDARRDKELYWHFLFFIHLNPKYGHINYENLKYTENIYLD